MEDNNKNAELAWKTWDYVKTLPHVNDVDSTYDGNVWNQATFGHVYDSRVEACFGGWVVILTDGYELVGDIRNTDVDDTNFDSRASELLGIRYLDASRLFYNGTSRDTKESYEAVITEIFGPRPAVSEPASG